MVACGFLWVGVVMERNRVPVLHCWSKESTTVDETVKLSDWADCVTSYLNKVDHCSIFQSLVCLLQTDLFTGCDIARVIADNVNSIHSTHWDTHVLFFVSLASPSTK